MPLISVCVVVYNLENYISECLSSILEQTYDDYELIVVDNGSTDSSIAICEEFLSRYSDRMKLFCLSRPSIPARGHAYAVEKAIGQYIHLIDGDDCVARDYLLRVDEIIRAQAPELLVGNFECILEKGASNYLDVKVDSAQINNVSADQAIDYLFRLPYFNRFVWRFIVSRRLFDLVKFDTSISHLIIADNIKSTVWLMHTKSIYHMEKPIYYYRRRVGSTVSSVNPAMTIDLIKGIVEMTNIIFALESEAMQQRFLVLQSSQIKWYLKLFCAGYGSLDDEHLILLHNYIEANKAGITRLQMYGLKFVDDWVDSIYLHGTKEGLRKFASERFESIAAGIDQSKGKSTYIFPAGKYAESTADYMLEAKFKIEGFLDNDLLKRNYVYKGLKCYQPDVLSQIGDGDKCNLMFVISTIYDELIPVFKEKLFSFGVEEQQIIVLE